MATNSPRIVNFNVGGVKHSTYISTITNFSRNENTLSILINQENEKRLIENGQEVFIDRNGNLFEHVLDFMRNKNMGVNTIFPKDEFFLNRLLTEAQYYQLSDLETLISVNLDSLTTHRLSAEYRVGDYVKFLGNVTDGDWRSCDHGDRESNFKMMREMKMYGGYRSIDEWVGEVKKVIGRCMIAEFSTTIKESTYRGHYSSYILHVPESVLKPM